MNMNEYKNKALQALFVVALSNTVTFASSGIYSFI